jgi:hypothetical protein
MIFANHNTPSIPHPARYRGLEYALKAYPFGHGDGVLDSLDMLLDSMLYVFLH